MRLHAISVHLMALLNTTPDGLAQLKRIHKKLIREFIGNYPVEWSDLQAFALACVKIGWVAGMYIDKIYPGLPFDAENIRVISAKSLPGARRNSVILINSDFNFYPSTQSLIEAGYNRGAVYKAAMGTRGFTQSGGVRWARITRRQVIANNVDVARLAGGDLPYAKDLFYKFCKVF